MLDQTLASTRTTSQYSMIQYTIVQYITVLCSIHRTQTLLSSSLCSHEQLVCKVDETNTPLKGYLFQQVHLVNCFIAMTPFKAQGGPFWTGQSHHKTSTNTTFQNNKIKEKPAQGQGIPRARCLSGKHNNS